MHKVWKDLRKASYTMSFLCWVVWTSLPISEMKHLSINAARRSLKAVPHQLNQLEFAGVCLRLFETVGPPQKSPSHSRLLDCTLAGRQKITLCFLRSIGLSYSASAHLWAPAEPRRWGPEQMLQISLLSQDSTQTQALDCPQYPAGICKTISYDCKDQSGASSYIAASEKLHNIVFFAAIIILRSQQISGIINEEFLGLIWQGPAQFGIAGRKSFVAMLLLQMTIWFLKGTERTLELPWKAFPK